MNSKRSSVRSWIIATGLLIFCFFLPLQCYIIGNNWGGGVQGAMFRYQMTSEGNSLITLPHEIEYITFGIYTGRTALSVILWTLGTLVLVCTAILSLVSWNNIPPRSLRLIVIGIAGSCILYLASCICQYGLFFSGPAGISLPLGAIIMAMFAAFLNFYPDVFIEPNTRPSEN